MEKVTKIGDETIIARFEQSKPGIVCPEFWECKPANGCFYDCEWCFLNNTYRFKKDKKGVKIGKAPTSKDPEKVKKHIREALTKINEPTLFNLGEVADAFIFPWMLEQHVLPIFKEFAHKGHKALLLTKNPEIGCLYNAKAQDCTIVAFSVNAKYVSETWETGAPHPWRRLTAAKVAFDWGYPVRLRIDPMVPVEDWEVGYRDLVDKIMEYVPKAEVITLGSLRMVQQNINVCKGLMNDMTYMRYLTEKTSRDMRAPTEVRVEMYTFVARELRKKGYKGSIALCKETDEVWDALCNRPLDPEAKDSEPLFLPPEKTTCNCKIGKMKEEVKCSKKTA